MPFGADIAGDDVGYDESGYDDVGASALSLLGVGDIEGDDVGYDDVGEDVGDVEGDDVGDDVGARRRRRHRRAGGANLAAQVKRLARQKMQAKQHAAMSRMARASKAGVLPQVFLGIDSSSTIAAAASSTLTTTSVSTIRLTAFTVSDTIAAQFIITAFTVGRLQLITGSQAMPAQMFSSQSNRPPIDAPLLPAGTNITLAVTNISAAAARFVGAFFCIDLTQNLCH